MLYHGLMEISGLASATIKLMVLMEVDGVFDVEFFPSKDDEVVAGKFEFGIGF